MSLTIAFFLSLISIGFISGFAGFYFSKMQESESNFKKVIYWLLYVVVIIGLAHIIGWIKTNTFIPETYKGIGTVLMISAVIPGILLAKKNR